MGMVGWGITGLRTAGFGAMRIAGSEPKGRHRVALAGALFGAALIGTSVWVMAHLYSDPYSGDLFWPHTLAVLAFVGLVVVVVSLSASGWATRTRPRAPSP